MRRGASRALAAAAVLLAAGPGCRRAAAPVAYDLAALAAVADVEGPWTIIRPATAAGRRAVASGLDPAPPGGAPHVLARRQWALALTLPDVRPRTLWLDLEPLAAQRLGVRLGGRRVARLELRPGRRTYVADLPSEYQQRGANAVELHFDDAEALLGEGTRHAARVYTVGVLAGPAAVPGPGPLFDVRDDAVTLPSGALVFGIVPSAGAELRFACRARGAGRLRAEWRPDGGAPRELWSAAAGDVGEVSLALPGAVAGRLALAFDADVPGSAQVTWVKPRVLGAQRGTTLDAPAWTAAEAARADALRPALRGAPLVLVVLDAARARQLGAYGYGRPTSPRIDGVAREGVVFERAYASAVFTLSAMSTLWTSLPPSLHHAGVPYDSPLPPEHLTLAELLSAAGIRTAGFVGNARAGAAYGMERGFGHWMESRAQAVGAGATELVDAARAWLRQQPDGRFFLYVHLREPHFPYDPPAPWSAMFPGPAVLPDGALRDPAWYRAANEARSLTAEQRDALVRAYDRNVAFADARVGDLVDELRSRGAWDRALVVVTADHGEALGEHGFVSHNEQVYEESTRIPLVVKLPGGSATGARRVPGLVGTIDLAPTFADAAGLLARAPAFRGRSLLPAIAGAPGRPAAVSRAAGEDSLYGVRTDRFKCLVDTRWGGEELYDLAADPDERHDVAAASPGRMSECRQALHRHLLDMRPSAVSTLRTRDLDPQQVENLRALGYIQ